MAVPDFQTLMRPVLEALQDGAPHSTADIRSFVSAQFELTPEDLAEKIPSGRAKTFQNRIGWALTYMHRAKLIDRPKRSTYQLTGRGSQVLADHPEGVNVALLGEFPEFVEFHQGGKSAGPQVSTPTAPGLEASSSQTPEEQIDHSYGELRTALAAELLDRVMDRSPDFFEQLVLDVLQAMGYGGRVGSPVHHLGQSGDEGVDGVIREDELGLDLIYVQAKRWANPVGRPEIQKFFGALHGKHANKGVFITTSNFSAEAVAYAESVTPRVILVDGKQLARLMIDHDVGTTVARRYELKRLDLDYFAADEDDTAGPAPGGLAADQSQLGVGDTLTDQE